MANLTDTTIFGDLTVTRNINNIKINPPASEATLTIVKPLTIGATSTYTGGVTITSSGTSDTTIRGPNNGTAVLTAGTMAITGGKLSQFSATTSAELAGVISDETGTGKLVFATSPTLTTPVLGVATATSINKVTITAPATSATLTIANGKTLTVSADATIAHSTHASGSDNQTITSGAGMNFTGGSGDVTITMGTPSALSASTSNSASGTTHTHSISTATAIALSNASVSGAGTSASLARADHTHAITGFALTGHTHNYAGSSSVGGSANSVVGLSVTSGKTLTVNNTITLNASADSKTLNIGDGGTLGTGAFADVYSLPTASASTLGGIKVGDGLAINSGVLSATTFRVKKLEEIVATNKASFNVGAFLPSDTFEVYLNGLRIPDTEYSLSTPNIILSEQAMVGDSIVIIKNEGSALEVSDSNSTNESVANTVVKRDTNRVFKTDGIQFNFDSNSGFLVKFNKDDKSLEIEYVGV